MAKARRQLKHRTKAVPCLRNARKGIVLTTKAVEAQAKGSVLALQKFPTLSNLPTSHLVSWATGCQAVSQPDDLDGLIQLASD